MIISSFVISSFLSDVSYTKFVRSIGWSVDSSFDVICSLHRLFICHLSLLSSGEIDARIDSFKVALAAGEDLVVTDHYAKDEVKEKMEKLETERDALLKLWEDRRISYEQCMDLMLFYRGRLLRCEKRALSWKF